MYSITMSYLRNALQTYESNSFWVLRIDEKQYHLQKLTFTFTFWDKRIDEKYLHLHLGIRGLMRKLKFTFAFWNQRIDEKR